MPDYQSQNKLKSLTLSFPNLLSHSEYRSVKNMWFLFRNYFVDWLEKLVSNILKMGPMPEHVGIICDGNRRFARKHKLESVIKGHNKGVETIEEIGKVLYNLGIKEVTLYVFSIENFKRSPEEVEGLMKLAIELGKKVLENIDKINEHGMNIVFVGDWMEMEEVPSELKQLMAKVTLLTAKNTKRKVNFAMAYTAQREIVRGAESLVGAIAHDEDFSVNDITEDTLDKSFHMKASKPVDLLIRTGGDQRMSDFLLWQASSSILEFPDVTWPEFSFWELFKIIIRYQGQMAELRGKGSLSKLGEGKESVVDWIRSRKLKSIAVIDKSASLLVSSMSEAACGS